MEIQGLFPLMHFNPRVLISQDHHPVSEALKMATEDNCRSDFIRWNDGDSIGWDISERMIAKL